jgi:hypothetical protein
MVFLFVIIIALVAGYGLYNMFSIGNYTETLLNGNKLVEDKLKEESYNGQ